MLSQVVGEKTCCQDDSEGRYRQMVEGNKEKGRKEGEKEEERADGLKKEREKRRRKERQAEGQGRGGRMVTSLPVPHGEFFPQP